MIERVEGPIWKVDRVQVIKKSMAAEGVSGKVSNNKNGNRRGDSIKSGGYRRRYHPLSQPALPPHV